LPAFEPEPNTAARARLLSFVTFAARLPMSRTFTATKTLDPMSRAGARL